MLILIKDEHIIFDIGILNYIKMKQAIGINDDDKYIEIIYSDKGINEVKILNNNIFFIVNNNIYNKTPIKNIKNYELLFLNNNELLEKLIKHINFKYLESRPHTLFKEKRKN